MAFFKVCFATLAIFSAGYVCGISPILIDLSFNSVDLWVLRAQVFGFVFGGVAIIFVTGEERFAGRRMTAQPKAQVHQFPTKGSSK